MKALLNETLAQTKKIDAFQFWTFDDLQARRVISSRTDLHRKQRYFGFPRAIHLTGGRRPAAVFDAAAVIAWVESRMKAEAAD